MRATFEESHAPPPWLRVVMYVVIPAAVLGYAYHAMGGGGLGVGAMVVLVILLCGAFPIELGVRLYGGTKVTGGVLSIGRRAVPVSALDMSTLSFTETGGVYDVFGSENLKSNPLWLRQTVAVKGHHDGREISVMVRTNRRDELVAALRAASAR